MTPVLEIDGLRKHYAGLRPLRLQGLRVDPGERVALRGLDAAAAEVLVNLITGATLPDEGEVRVLGQRTADIESGDAWLTSLDRFGLVSGRGVLLEGFTLAQNLAMPFTLAIDSIPPAVESRVVQLAAACGIPREALSERAEAVPPEIRVRVHLARAVALEPRLLVLEHPSAGLPDDARAALADDIVRATGERNLAALVLTSDQELARMVAHRTLILQPASGALVPDRVRRGWFW